MTDHLLSADAFIPGADAWPILQAALDTYRAVEIPALPFPLELSRALVFSTGCRLKVAPETVITDRPGCGGCLLRNAHLAVGALAPEEDPYTDTDMEVEGGVWQVRTPIGTGKLFSYENDPAPELAFLGQRGTLLGVLFFSGAKRVALRHITVRESDFYGILLSRCTDFTAEDLFFDDQHKDGIHVNGPAEDGRIFRVRGTCGDDIVALNAWDWHSSAVTYGPIRRVTIEDVTADHDEMRLLPGRKRYDDGRERDCPIQGITLRRISGMYSFKMYQQPYCNNKARGMDDRSVTAGILEDITFEEIDLDGRETQAISEVVLAAPWEIGADARRVAWKNIRVRCDREAFTGSGMRLVALGPKSSTWTQGDPDPATWQELFEPDLLCHGEDFSLEGVTFAGDPCTDPETLIRVIHLSPNPDYPHTRPQGGTGYGILTGFSVR